MAKTTTAPADTSSAEDAPEDLNTATVTLEWEGQKFEVPKRRGRWPLEAILQFGRGQGLRATHELLGATDWERLKTVCPTGDDFDKFIDYAIDFLKAECIL